MNEERQLTDDNAKMTKMLEFSHQDSKAATTNTLQSAIKNTQGTSDRKENLSKEYKALAKKQMN